MVKYGYKGEYTDYLNREEDFKKGFGEDCEIYKQDCRGRWELQEGVYRKSGKKDGVKDWVGLKMNVKEQFMGFMRYWGRDRMGNIEEMYF